MKLTRFWRPGPRLAFDVGTANIRVISAEGGVLLDEPAICCFDANVLPARLIAAGAQALAMVDRTTPGLIVQRALHRGVLQDLEATRALLRHARRRALGWSKSSRDTTLIGIPADATEVERRALLNAAREANLGSVRLVSEPMAAAVGAGLPVDDARGSMLIECGAGTTEVVVISLGGVSVRRTVRVGGDTLDQAIADHLHWRFRFVIGKHTAQRVKLEISEAACHASGRVVAIGGRSLETGLPTSLNVPMSEFQPVVQKHVARIVETVKECLGDTPPELSRDIYEHGITLTGGSAYLPWIRQMVATMSGLDVVIADQAQHCVALGLQQLLRLDQPSATQCH